tara:strand:+ start:406 stop:1155 length:750 start_codon:yes stop_codon:yes gene_type:complete
MAYFNNNLNQKIAYKYVKRESPGIIYVHGLNSDMEGTKAIEIEKYAKKNNLSFLKFDCRGHGKSFGKFEDFGISDWKKDLIDLLDNITTGPQIIIGSSMGGWLMLLAAKARSKRICGLIGIAAAPDFGKGLYSSLSKNNKKNIQKKGFAKITTKYGSYILSKKFFTDANRNIVLTKSFRFKKPIILIHGLNDEIVNSEVPKKIMEKTSGNNIQIIYIKSSDHQLSKIKNIITINSAIDNLKNQILSKRS